MSKFLGLKYLNYLKLILRLVVLPRPILLHLLLEEHPQIWDVTNYRTQIMCCIPKSYLKQKFLNG